MQINYWYIVTGMATSFLFCIAMLMFYLKYRKNIIQQQYLLKVAELSHHKALLNSVITAQEEESKRIAVAVHDDIGNRLNILMLMLNRLELADDNVTNHIKDQVMKITDMTRSISHTLYPVNLEALGLILYIEELIVLVADSIAMSLRVSFFVRKSSFVEVQLFRIIQEFTTNVLKHANASKIEIWIRGSMDNISLVLSDNGTGFDYKNVSKGMGLKNIESRVQVLNGSYKWKKITEGGSRLIISI